ncbi:MAG: ATP-dependent DNA helicase RecG [Pyrinomonadaceae bacterium]
MKLTFKTPILEFPRHKIAKLSVATARKLAIAVAQHSDNPDPAAATVEDLLNYFPTRYEDRSNLVGLDALEDGIESAVEVYVKVSGGYRVGKNRHPKQPPLFIFEISGSDAERQQRPVVVKWFVSGRQAERIVGYYQERYSRGIRFIAYGKWEWDANRNTFSLMVAKPDEIEILADPLLNFTGEAATSPQAEEPNPKRSKPESDVEVEIPELAFIHSARIVPIYRKLGDLSTKRLREIIHSTLDDLDTDSILDHLPGDLLERQKLLTRSQALREIHFPPDGAALGDYEIFRSPAQRRLIFDEFFWLAFSMQLLRGERQKEPKGTVIEIGERTKESLKNLLPFALTEAQKRVVGEIFADLKSDAPMNRLIQGDVGSGKTIVAFLAVFATLENGYQAALMAPTEILAEQHFRNAARIFGDAGYRIELLIGSLKAGEKRNIHAGLVDGSIDFVIGTNAIIQDAVAFEKLGLAVIDEQHRFGVMQRAQLKESGNNPDVLVMTATPIPRSLAMTVYGDLDVSTIDELPPGRTPIKTVVVGEDQRSGVYKGIDREVRLGRQAYVVYPLIEESEKLDLKAATKMFEDIKTRIFPQYTVGLLHGKMKSADKDATMREFVEGRLDILVSTTVIEVGVDVPNASLMVIEHAERFGLSQLHQLRGRVGRGSDQSYCVLLTDHKKTAVAKERLGIMEQTSDGFEIAEKDLELRGEGEILGTRQSGIQNFRLGNLARDLEILIAARDEALEYLTTRRLSPDTSAMVKLARSDKNVTLGSVA